jgi:hypothetical protein
MSNKQKWLLIICVLIFSIGVLFCGLKGRYQWYAGQDFGRLGAYYPPRLVDTWTGIVTPW